MLLFIFINFFILISISIKSIKNKKNNYAILTLITSTYFFNYLCSCLLLSFFQIEADITSINCELQFFFLSLRQNLRSNLFLWPYAIDATQPKPANRLYCLCNLFKIHDDKTCSYMGLNILLWVKLIFRSFIASKSIKVILYVFCEFLFSFTIMPSFLLIGRLSFSQY